MKVFISWSGGLSRTVAEILKKWLKCVLQATDPWISTEDIAKGTIWFNEINDQLKDTSIGIICLTSENLTSPWILFEAGALAKGLSKTRVCTFLIDLKPAELQQPLASFNATTPSKEDVFKLVGTINESLGDRKLDNDILRTTFEQFWTTFITQFENATKAYVPALPAQTRGARPVSDMVEELLVISRQHQHLLESIREAQAVGFALAHTSGGRSNPRNLVDYLARLDNQLDPVRGPYFDPLKPATAPESTTDEPKNT